MKKLLSIILALTFVLSTATVAFAATEPIKATKTSSAVMVNGKEVKFEAYNINDNNYFKLRDIAKALNGSEKQFEVTWDGAKNAINLITDKAYTVVGGELEVGKSTKLNVRNTDSRIYVDGIEVSIKAYNINGNNYFKLRDLGEFIGFGVDWDGANNKILIDTKTVVAKAPYTFSKTKLDYPYNIYVEDKGYINFGKDKPFMENGKLYLPIKHLAHLGNSVDYTWDKETNSVVIGKNYTEKEKFDGKTAGEVLEPLVRYKDGTKELWQKDGTLYYYSRSEIVLKAGDNTAVGNDYRTISDWGLDFLASGGYFVIQRPGTEYLNYDDVVNMLSEPISDELYVEYPMVVKNGEPYLERSLLNALTGTTMLTDEDGKTLYFGSDEFIAEKLQEMEKTIKIDEQFNDNGSYMDMMDDLFKDVEEYKPVN